MNFQDTTTEYLDLAIDISRKAIDAGDHKPITTLTVDPVYDTIRLHHNGVTIDGKFTRMTGRNVNNQLAIMEYLTMWRGAWKSAQDVEAYMFGSCPDGGPLWGRNIVHVAIHKIRRKLGWGIIETDNNGYRRIP
jgi:hypothetical protein